MACPGRFGVVGVARARGRHGRDRLVLDAVGTEDVHPDQAEQDSDRGQGDRDTQESSGSTLR